MIPTYLQAHSQKKITIIQLGERMDYDSSISHRHDYFELFIFTKGGGVNTIDFQEFEIHDHSIHIVAPGKVHCVDRAKHSDGFVLLFEHDLLAHLPIVSDFLFDLTCYSIEEFSPAFLFTEHSKSVLSQLTNQIWENYNSDKTYRFEAVSHQVAQVCFACLDLLKDYIPVLSSSKGDTYIAFRKLVHLHFRDKKKVQDYAEILCVSDKHLNEIVKRQTGKSASKLIYGQLITEAKRLLNSGLTVKEVGFELKFDDPAHFSKFFKTQTGSSPSDFRIIHA